MYCSPCISTHTQYVCVCVYICIKYILLKKIIIYLCLEYSVVVDGVAAATLTALQLQNLSAVLYVGLSKV